ncbi:MAG: LacI family DNA-binding transcriptional regulator [Opitutaceae bacterium]|jgi:LacI family transcriptional regulator|nr:LacI family DNA-binding transcriptional regulator [Opitutaceae bacterium]
MPGNRRVTLADIAKRAEVHVTTVSLALRNHPRLPERTRTRIQQLAKEMGYHPDPVLQALVAYRGKVMERRNPPTLAYVTNWDTKLGWQKTTAHPEFYEGAKAKAEELGFKLDHFWMGEPGLSHTRMSKILQARGITGVIIASHRRASDVSLHFDWSAFSAVKIEYFPHEPELHQVNNDHCSIMRLAMQRAEDHGYKRIGAAMHRGWDHAVDHHWEAGLLISHAFHPPEERIPIHMFPEAERVDEWMTETTGDVVADTAQFKAWYKTHRPEVIISKRSFIQPCLDEMGLKIPEDVAFIDLFLEEEELDGSVAGVRQNHHAVGELALEILAGQLHYHKYGIPAIPTRTQVEGTWFDGATCPPFEPAKTKPTTRKKSTAAKPRKPSAKNRRKAG